MARLQRKLVQKAFAIAQLIIDGNLYIQKFIVSNAAQAFEEAEQWLTEMREAHPHAICYDFRLTTGVRDTYVDE